MNTSTTDIVQLVDGFMQFSVISDIIIIAIGGLFGFIILSFIIRFLK